MNDRCGVCGETENDPQRLEICSNCGQFFHLNPFQNRPGTDCGNVWPSADDAFLQFGCNTCLEAQGLPSTTAEAAAVAGSSTGAPPDPRELARMQEALLAALGGGIHGEEPASGPPVLQRRDRARRRYRRVDQ